MTTGGTRRGPITFRQWAPSANSQLAGLSGSGHWEMLLVAGFSIMLLGMERSVRIWPMGNIACGRFQKFPAKWWQVSETGNSQGNQCSGIWGCLYTRWQVGRFHYPLLRIFWRSKNLSKLACSKGGSKPCQSATESVSSLYPLRKGWVASSETNHPRALQMACWLCFAVIYVKFWFYRR